MQGHDLGARELFILVSFSVHGYRLIKKNNNNSNDNSNYYCGYHDRRFSLTEKFFLVKKKTSKTNSIAISMVAIESNYIYVCSSGHFKQNVNKKEYYNVLERGGS